MESQASRGIGNLVAGNILTTAAVRFGEREAFFCSETGRRLSFRQVDERCNRLANALTGLGLRKGDVVAVLTSNRVEIVESLFAIAKTGIVGLPLNYRLAPNEVVSLMNAVGAQGLICEARFTEALQRAIREVPTLRQCVLFGGAAPDGVHDYEALLAASAASEPEIAVEEWDPFYFNLTSGTSGLPKCYILTHYNNATVTPMFTAMEVTSRDTFLTVFPMFGRVGYAWAAAGLYFGARNVIANFEPGRVLQLIDEERVTLTNLVATMGAMLLAHPDLPGRDLSSLRGTVFAGSMLPEPIRRGVTERICPSLYEYYGMQETGALVLSTPEDRQVRPDSVGRVIAHAEVRIVDDAGKRLAPGEIGEIIGRAPTGTTAYYQNPEKTAETFRDGWIHTGDLGSLDAQGYLFIRGRKKDMIVTGGQNVFAAEVEEALLDHPGVAECAVIGLPDPLWGERVSAVIVVAPGASVEAADLTRHCRERLASFKTPRQFVLQAEPLPRTPTGKVQKFLLVERHGAPPGAASAP
jgi:fatty-acyl-CoA synthase